MEEIKIGGVYGRLVVLRLDKTNPCKQPSRAKYICQCRCGKIVSYSKYWFYKVDEPSCGCYKSEKMAERNKKYRTIKHGLCGNPLYSILQGIKTRCYDDHRPQWNLYGGRGIKVCDRWLNSPEAFFEDMEKSYLEHKQNNSSTTIERIAVNGDYTPENCCWKTRAEQNGNCRRNLIFKAIRLSDDFEVIEKNKTQFWKDYGVAPNIITECLKGLRRSHNGWKFEYV